MGTIPITVVISTYNAPEWLAKVLWGYGCQTHRDFEVVIADDGSGPETKACIERLRETSSLDIRHVWHEDLGYRRQTILNEAVRRSSADYLLFTDGDCIPRRDLVQTHAELARPGRFLSGGYCKLPMALSESIGEEDILSQVCFDPAWLRARGLEGRSQLRKLSAGRLRGRWYDALTPTRASFNNCNSSVWKADILRVNGYDERIRYGGSDRELGERLENAGIKGKQVRHRAICLHLDHTRGYKTAASMEESRIIRRNTRRNAVIETPAGIVKRSDG
jgi:glycosyltransferase involved in cell wall biosynthesis